MAPRKIIIDTDPGQDDAAAIMLALASPETIAQFRRAFPAFGTVDIPQGRFEPLAD